MLISITGGTGFIGWRLAQKHLAQGDHVRVLSRRPAGSVALPAEIEIHSGDLNSGERSLQRFTQGADILYHCAAELRDESRMHSTNIEGTRALLDAAHGTVGRWVQLSSVGVYGSHRNGTVDEATPLAPGNLYEKTKAEADRMVMTAAAAGKLSATILRPSIVYGPGMPNQSLFGLINIIKRGWFFFIGKPGASANYIYIDNVVDALLLCGTLPQAAGQAYNLSDYATLEHFVDVLAHALDRKAPHLRINEAIARNIAELGELLPGFPLTVSRVDALVNRSRYPSDRIMQELHYQHRVGMDEGLNKLVHAWKARAHPC